MQKKFIFVIAFSLILCLVGCGKINTEIVNYSSDVMEEKIVLPAVRVGTDGEAETRLYRSYTFSEAFQEAGAVAIIEIGNWLSESEEHLCTWFEATPITVYKGELPQKFIFGQPGYSKITVSHFPLFSYGEKLLVFFAPDKMQGFEYENFEFSLGSYSTVGYIVEDSSGHEYIMDWLGVWGCSVPNVKNYIGDVALYAGLKKNLDEIDAILGFNVREFQSIISVEDFEIEVQKMI